MTDGSLRTMPRPFMYTRVFAVPRSIARSRAIRGRLDDRGDGRVHRAAEVTGHRHHHRLPPAVPAVSSCRLLDGAPVATTRRSGGGTNRRGRRADAVACRATTMRTSAASATAMKITRPVDTQVPPVVSTCRHVAGTGDVVGAGAPVGTVGPDLVLPDRRRLLERIDDVPPCLERLGAMGRRDDGDDRRLTEFRADLCDARSRCGRCRASGGGPRRRSRRTAPSPDPRRPRR